MRTGGGYGLGARDVPEAPFQALSWASPWSL